jgi:hypothetical protein
MNKSYNLLAEGIARLACRLAENGRGPTRRAFADEDRVLAKVPARPNQTEAGRKSLRERVVVEHRIARLVQLVRDSPQLLLRENENPMVSGDGSRGRQPEFGDGTL